MTGWQINQVEYQADQLVKKDTHLPFVDFSITASIHCYEDVYSGAF